MAKSLRSFHPPPVIGFLLLLVMGVTEYQYNKPQPLPGHHAGFFLACDSIPASPFAECNQRRYTEVTA